MEVDAAETKQEKNEKTDKEKASRKRRRSEMEEASTMTIISSSTKEKRKKKEADNGEKLEDMKADTAPQASASSQDEKEKPSEMVEVKEPENSAPNRKESLTSTNVDLEKGKETPKQSPIKLVISTKSNKIIEKSPIISKVTTTPKIMPIKIRPAKVDKTSTVGRITRDKDNKEEKIKSYKRRNSKSNKSLNNSIVINSDKPDKASEKLDGKNAATDANKEQKETPVKSKENSTKLASDKRPATPKTNGDTKSAKDSPKPAKDSPKPAKDSPKPAKDSPKPAKDRIQFDDDDTSLAVIAREGKGNVTNSGVSGLPTISSVRSLSVTAKNTSATTKTGAKTYEVTVEANSNSLLIPTSASSVRKEPTKGKDVEPSMVGRVGVRAFARMASPDTPAPRGKDVEIEIKAEPIDFDDPDRQLEKLDMMKAFKLRPVNPPANSLREVNIRQPYLIFFNLKDRV